MQGTEIGGRHPVEGKCEKQGAPGWTQVPGTLDSQAQEPNENDLSGASGGRREPRKGIWEGRGTEGNGRRDSGVRGDSGE